MEIPTITLDPGLYIVATPIGNLGDITLRALEVLKNVDIIICEDTRVTNKLLSHYDIKASMHVYNDGAGDKTRAKILGRLEEGASMALVSDAGTPLISDPGYKLVREAKARDIAVTTLPGASSVTAALTLSGLPSNNFMFCGFLPNKTQARRNALAEFKHINTTLIFLERASRTAGSLADMLEVFGEREASIVREISKTYEQAITDPLSNLIESCNKEAPRGEVVIIVAPPTDIEASQEQLDELLIKSLKTMSTKDAAAYVAEILNLPKKQVYTRALELG